MRIGKTTSHALIDATIETLSKALNFRSANHHLIAGNMANIDTPGYKPRELRFDQELQRASNDAQVRLSITDSNHLPLPSNGPGNDYRVHIGKSYENGDKKMNLDMEMARMMRNNLLYETSSRLLTKKFRLLRSVIEDGRR